MWDHPGSSSWALNPGTSVLEKKHWGKRRCPCEYGGREWSYAAASQGMLGAACALKFTFWGKIKFWKNNSELNY